MSCVYFDICTSIFKFTVYKRNTSCSGIIHVRYIALNETTFVRLYRCRLLFASTLNHSYFLLYARSKYKRFISQFISIFV